MLRASGHGGLDIGLVGEKTRIPWGPKTGGVAYDANGQSWRGFRAHAWGKVVRIGLPSSQPSLPKDVVRVCPLSRPGQALGDWALRIDSHCYLESLSRIPGRPRYLALATHQFQCRECYHQFASMTPLRLCLWQWRCSPTPSTFPTPAACASTWLIRRRVHNPSCRYHALFCECRPCTAPDLAGW